MTNSTPTGQREAAAPRSGRPLVESRVFTKLLKHGLRVAAHCALVAAASGLGAAELGADVDSLLSYARTHNPELAAMRFEADAAGQRIQPAGALPDPVMRVELENINNYGTDRRASLLPSKVGETKYTLMQPIPLWGKRELRRDAAAADAQQAAARADIVWRELAAKLKAGFAQYYLVTGNERLTIEILDLLSSLERLAQSRYAGGLVAQQDAIRAQVEQTAMRSELIALDNEKRQVRTRLNALLARDVTSPLAEPQALRQLPGVTVTDAGSLAQRARAANPALAAEEARLRTAQSNRELTYKNRYPDLNVGISPTQMGSRITTWGVMVELNIPLQQQTRRLQESESETMISAQRSRIEALANQLLGELGENLSALDAARRSETLITTHLLPQSEVGFRSALAAYETGKVDFATLLDAQRQIRKARQDRLKAQVEARLRLADIERIVGEDL